MIEVEVYFEEVYVTTVYVNANSPEEAEELVRDMDLVAYIAKDE